MQSIFAQMTFVFTSIFRRLYKNLTYTILNFDGRVVLHLHFMEDAKKIIREFESPPENLTFTSSNLELISFLLNHGVSQTNIIKVPNLGRNLGPIYFANLTKKYRQSFFLFLHIKRTVGLPRIVSKAWTIAILRNIRQLRSEYMQSNSLAFPTFFFLFRNRSLGWSGTEGFLRQLNKDDLDHKTSFLFPEGGMFACGRDYLKTLEGCEITSQDFGPEPINQHGDFEHFAERLIGALASESLPVIVMIGKNFFSFEHSRKVS